MTRIATFALIVLLGTALVLLLILAAGKALRSARHSPAGVGAVAWALLFLTSGRMPPPPPSSQIEVDVGGKKDREGSRNIEEV